MAKTYKYEEVFCLRLSVAFKYCEVQCVYLSVLLCVKPSGASQYFFWVAVSFDAMYFIIVTNSVTIHWKIKNAEIYGVTVSWFSSGKQGRSRQQGEEKKVGKKGKFMGEGQRVMRGFKRNQREEAELDLNVFLNISIWP